jgi:hypothetical protein
MELMASPPAADVGLELRWSDRLLFAGSLTAFFFFFMSLIIIQLSWMGEILKLIQSVKKALGCLLGLTVLA